mmetsp:Transcript_9084/g.26054  ORF Transcript_9084/g.26054 Transcript_9084/m.26054 type:complete len:718 (+) Transcript_9084:353-2506(+)
MSEEITAKMADVSVEAKAANKEAIFQSRLSDRLPYYQKRVELFESYLERESSKLEAAKAAAEPIKIIMPDGAERAGIKLVTTPFDVAKEISSGLAKKCVVAKVDGSTWDMARPLEGDCALQLLTFDDSEGKETFWHSSAHVLGEALELEFGVDLTIGPPIEEGFYYDCSMGDATLTDSDLTRVEKRVSNAIKEKQRFQRVVVSRDEALEMFQENKFKIEIIQGLPADATISVYRVGPMVDLCSGPHVPDTSILKAVALTSCSRAFWRADTSKDALQRVYAITFPDNKQLKDYQHRIAEAKKRDHRLLGQQYNLFFFHPLSPGSCFFQPLGARIYNSLVNYIKEKYWEYEYDEVMTPNMYNFDLWKTSGHADHYKENMFSIDIEKQEFGLKPMNCPGHCLMFNSRVRSYRELPLRMADFGVLHRNEYSGALHGLTRVRRFQQDDAHIFCRPDQVMQEVSGFLQMLNEAYGVFGLDYELALSTRPEAYMGELEVWNKAEAALTEALNSTGREWKENPEDGAFYGPKIDITVLDALKRRFQCATVQLDFQLPIRFDLSYMTEETGVTARPVIVHRAILGSVERMFAILTEHYAGKWPLWLSPRQVMVVPISEASYAYAEEVKKEVRKGGFFVEADCSDRKMQKKVREAQLDQFNYILVVGAEEATARTVNVRTRDNVVHGQQALADLLVKLKEEKASRSLVSAFGEAAPNPGAEGEEAAE